jgi:hypothetical protein
VLARKCFGIGLVVRVERGMSREESRVGRDFVV